MKEKLSIDWSSFSRFQSISINYDRPRENKGTERETPSIALGICEFLLKLFLDVVKTDVVFSKSSANVSRRL